MAVQKKTISVIVHKSRSQSIQKIHPHKITAVTVLINSKNEKSAIVKSVIIFGGMVSPPEVVFRDQRTPPEADRTKKTRECKTVLRPQWQSSDTSIHQVRASSPAQYRDARQSKIRIWTTGKTPTLHFAYRRCKAAQGNREGVLELVAHIMSAVKE